MGTVDPRAAVGRVWVQLSSPMQDSGACTLDIIEFWLCDVVI